MRLQPSLTILAIALACSGGGHVPRDLALASASRQTGRAGAAVGSAPAVLIRDRQGHPQPGVTVDFAVVAGGGTVSPSSVETGPDGVARAAWLLGGEGEQVLQASSPDADGAVTWQASLLDGTRFTVDLRLLDEAADEEWAAFTGAAQRISQVIVGKLTPAELDGASCAGTAMDGAVEGLLVVVRIHPIDGLGGILGQSSPCIRRRGGLPAVALLELDAADAADQLAKGRLPALVLHEMLHDAGFGTDWSAFDRSPLPPLATGAHTSSSTFGGPQALAAARGEGAPSSWTGVPLEDCGPLSPRPCGPGTQDVHWREPVFGDEIMTGWLTGERQPLSRTTIGSLGDLGYEVDVDAADPFQLASAAPQGEAVRAQDPGEPLGDDILRIPVVEVP